MSKAKWFAPSEVTPASGWAAAKVLNASFNPFCRFRLSCERCVDECPSEARFPLAIVAVAGGVLSTRDFFSGGHYSAVYVRTGVCGHRNEGRVAGKTLRGLRGRGGREVVQWLQKGGT